MREGNLWPNDNYAERLGLQVLMFPEGVLSDKGAGNCRIERVDAASVLTLLARVYWNKKKKGEISRKTNFSLSVVHRGIEPLLPE